LLVAPLRRSLRRVAPLRGHGTLRRYGREVEVVYLVVLVLTLIAGAGVAAHYLLGQFSRSGE
jgi:hypothetical protein